MSKIIILTDSASDLDPSLIASLPIEVVSLKISFGQETFVHGQLTTSQFYEKLKNSAVLPTTSQPSPLDFVEKYNQIVEKYGRDVQIIGILLSAALSGTYQSAVIGKSMLEEDVDITLIDSRKASLLYGMCAIDAARMAEAGATKQQILDHVDRFLHEVRVFFMVDTFTYLQKGGRIGAASALIGSLLNIKPILTLAPDGTVTPFERVRGTKKAISRMIEEMKAYAGSDPVKAAVVHSDVPAVANELMERIQADFQVKEAYIADIGAVIGTHAGPGTIGIMMGKV